MKETGAQPAVTYTAKPAFGLCFAIERFVFIL